MRHRHRTSGPVVVLAVAALLAFASLACGDDDQIELRWTVDLASQQQLLHQVGPANASVYGWNRLVGDAEIDGQRVGVEMLGNVAYEHGNGPFFGFVTVTFADGSTLGMRMQGNTNANADTASAEFDGSVTLLGGTGQYADASGTGRLSGTRDARLGGLVRMDFLVRLSGATP